MPVLKLLLLLLGSAVGAAGRFLAVASAVGKQLGSGFEARACWWVGWVGWVGGRDRSRRQWREAIDRSRALAD
jgi:hypothetical protein